ncbi:methylosome subunit pICln isoform X1 [Anopheles coustani]|uniref:methylosome subunit pICln isoform X1 n=1 Tax=Anopheles coustani TaxID=139045 RepID=UPI0026583BBD|nr:methylosome subunit pICln isoform X1 [Anopheles coustani]
MVTIGNAFTPVDGIVYSATDIKLKIGTDVIPSLGTLHLTYSSCIWSCEERNSSISIPWPRVGVQAISSTPGEGIFVMLDIDLVWPGFYQGRPEHNGNAHPEDDEGLENEDDEGHESDASEAAMTEMWFQPRSSQNVDEIFSAMRECQSLNPGSEVSEDEDYMEAEEEDLQEVGEMQNLQLDDEDKFADAEE